MATYDHGMIWPATQSSSLLRAAQFAVCWTVICPGSRGPCLAQSYRESTSLGSLLCHAQSNKWEMGCKASPPKPRFAQPLLETPQAIDIQITCQCQMSSPFVVANTYLELHGQQLPKITYIKMIKGHPPLVVIGGQRNSLKQV